MAYRTHLDHEVLADRDQRPMLVVHLHAQTVRGPRNLGNREAGLGRQRRAVDDQNAALKHLAHWLVEIVGVLELLVDELWSPAHHLADVGEAEHRQFAQNLLNGDFGPLGAGSEDFFDARRPQLYASEDCFRTRAKLPPRSPRRGRSQEDST
jgi:hypothetical protein